MLTPFIQVLLESLSEAPASFLAKEDLTLLFDETDYGCQKQYPVAIVHEQTRMTEPSAHTFFQDHGLLDTEGFTPCTYTKNQLQALTTQVPQYIQNVNFIFSKTKSVPHPLFFNKFKHDYWKKIQSVDGLEAVVDVSTLTTHTHKCDAETTLRDIIRKRKEVHQLKKLTFVWIVEVIGENAHIETVMKHYFENAYSVIQNNEKTYYIGWSAPLQSINMRYFVCPPE